MRQPRYFESAYTLYSLRRICMHVRTTLPTAPTRTWQQQYVMLYYFPSTRYWYWYWYPPPPPPPPPPIVPTTLRMRSMWVEVPT